MDNRHFYGAHLSDMQICHKIWDGKHISAWFFLRDAARSSFIHAYQSSCRWLINCQKGKTKCNSLAERVLIANGNYSLLLSGPLLSSLILSAACIEAFARHCYVSVLRAKLISDKKLSDMMSDFEEMKPKPVAQIKRSIKEVEAKEMSELMESKIADLSQFRNDIMHSDPVYHSQIDGELIQLKHGRSKAPRRYKYYPDLTLSNRPLTLNHAIRSIITHDELIAHISKTSENVNVLNFFTEIDMTNNDKGLIWGFMPGITYDQAKSVAEGMDKMNNELDKVTLKEQIAFIKKEKNIWK